MTHVPVDLGIVSADAERVEVHFAGGDLVLAFVGYDELPRRHVFHDAEYVHYLVCFNACRALDVLCRRAQSPR